jgi:hypothetical protein
MSIQKDDGLLKLNEIRSMIKFVNLIKGGCFRMVAEEVLKVKTFYNSYENLI